MSGSLTVLVPGTATSTRKCADEGGRASHRGHDLAKVGQGFLAGREKALGVKSTGRWLQAGLSALGVALCLVAVASARPVDRGAPLYLAGVKLGDSAAVALQRLGPPRSDSRMQSDAATRELTWEQPHITVWVQEDRVVFIHLVEPPLDLRCGSHRLSARADPEDVRSLFGRGNEMLLRTCDGTQPSLNMSYRGRQGAVVLNFFFKQGRLTSVDVTGRLGAGGERR